MLFQTFLSMEHKADISSFVPSLLYLTFFKEQN